MSHHHSSKKKKLKPLGVALRAVAFLFPGAFFALLVGMLFPTFHLGFLYVGTLGCLLAGIGLVFLCGLWDHIWPGLTVTAAFLLSGFLILCGSLWMLYAPDILSQVEYQVPLWYGLLWAFCLVPPLWYPLFRKAFHHYLKGKGFAHGRLEYKLKGAKNYWFFDTLRGSFNMPVIYWLNKLYILVFLGALALQLVLGWWQVISGAVSFLLCMVLIMGAIMWWLFAFDKSSRHGHDNAPSTVLTLFALLIPIATCIGLVILSIAYVDTMSFRFVG